MVSIEKVRKLALSFPQTDEHPHFDRKAFRVKKKICATLSEKYFTVSLKLNLTDQSVFCAYDATIIYPVPGGWGRMGFTYVNLKKVRWTMFKDALTVAYATVAPPALGAKFLKK